jgi:dipeptidyl aminopeptidase/acylaminoacyl peptidase
MRIRRVHFFLILLLFSWGCGNHEEPRKLTGPVPADETQQADYATARATFRTKLLKRGSSPEPPSAVPFSRLKRPAGVEEVEYFSGSLRLKAWLQAPAKDPERRRPAVLFLHGGWGFDEGDWEHTRPFRDAGYVVLAPVLRGENGCPGDFTMFYDEVDDVLAAAEFLARLPYVNPQAIYLAGYSAGGTLAMLAAMTSGRFRAAASLDGSPDRRSFIQGREDEVPFDVSDPEEFRLRSPGEFATSIKCPMRLYCSYDRGGFIEETRRLAQSARSNGLDVQMVTVPGNHATFRLPATKLAIDFFRSIQPG